MLPNFYNLKKSIKLQVCSLLSHLSTLITSRTRNKTHSIRVTEQLDSKQQLKQLFQISHPSYLSIQAKIQKRSVTQRHSTLISPIANNCVRCYNPIFSILLLLGSFMGAKRKKQPYHRPLPLTKKWSVIGIR